MADLDYRDTPDQIDRETLLLLGADLKARGFRVPTVTVAGIALLDLIDSPFLTGKREPELWDVFRALYVLERQSEAVDAILAASRATKSLAELKDDAMRSPETAAGYYAAVAQASQAWAPFDAEVAAFAEGCGQFDLSEVVLGLRESISRSCGGFAMIQRDESTEKKTGRDASLTVRGLRRLWPLFRRCAMLAWTRFCTACRLR